MICIYIVGKIFNNKLIVIKNTSRLPLRPTSRRPRAACTPRVSDEAEPKLLRRHVVLLQPPVIGAALAAVRRTCQNTRFVAYCHPRVIMPYISLQMRFVIVSVCAPCRNTLCALLDTSAIKIRLVTQCRGNDIQFFTAEIYCFHSVVVFVD